MTPQEKANQLVNVYYNGIMSFLTNNMKLENAKKCALIAVDEILDVDCCDMSEAYFYNHIEYWQEVKQEIEKL
jgi:hypothetical protein